MLRLRTLLWTIIIAPLLPFAYIFMDVFILTPFGFHDIEAYEVEEGMDCREIVETGKWRCY